MFGSEILEVAIGLVLVFLLFSLIASAIREGIESMLKSRAVLLERGVRTLLDDPRGAGLSRDLYDHPLVRSLYHDDIAPAPQRRLGIGLPTYIPSRSFAVALLDLTANGSVEYGTPTRSGASLEPATLRENVRHLESPRVRRAVLTAIELGRGDIERIIANLQTWFDASMERVSGWYKRRTQFWLFAIGLVLAVAINVDAIAIAEHLWKSDAARAAIVRRAEIIAQDSTYRQAVRDTGAVAASIRTRYEEVRALDLPIGFGTAFAAPAAGVPAVPWPSRTAGWLITALAITLGAPFWFDLLNKFMVIRSTVKMRERSQDEGSEDRRPDRTQSTGAPAAPPTLAPPVSVPPSVTTPASPSAGSPDAAGGGGSVLTVVESRVTTTPAGYAPNEWRDGEPEEGVL